MPVLTQEDIKNILVLIGKAPLIGTEATTVALLQQKLTQMSTPTTQNDAEVATEK